MTKIGGILPIPILRRKLRKGVLRVKSALAAMTSLHRITRNLVKKSTEIGSIWVLSKWARSTALTACSMICDRLKPSWHTGITKSDFCRLMGIRSIKKSLELWNTRNRGRLEEKRTACFDELSHYVNERSGILQVLRIRETWKGEEYIELIGRPK